MRGGWGGVARAPAVPSCPGLSLEALSLRVLEEGGVEVGFNLGVELSFPPTLRGLFIHLSLCVHPSSELFIRPSIA